MLLVKWVQRCTLYYFYDFIKEKINLLNLKLTLPRHVFQSLSTSLSIHHKQIMFP